MKKKNLGGGILESQTFTIVTYKGPGKKFFKTFFFLLTNCYDQFKNVVVKQSSTAEKIRKL